ncbi:peptidylprolyl isomerase [bacterium]|nr:peptidylprolyl isomerase [bacterium]
MPHKAVIKTSKGTFEAELYADETPVTVRNFQFLAERGFYENLTFHRHDPGFVVQGGDPKGSGLGGPGYTLPPEHSDTLKHLRGVLGMARLPDQVNPERKSNGSQFYVVLAEKTPHLDGLYTVFGKVTLGMDVVDALTVGDKILSVKVSE